MAVGRAFASSAIFVLAFGFFSPLDLLDFHAFGTESPVLFTIDYASLFPGKEPFSLDGRHVVPVPRGRKYLSSRICLYPNAQISFNLMRLAISGDVNPNPGPVSSGVSKTLLAEPTRVNHVSWLSLNARSIVNKRVELASRLSSVSFDLVAVTKTWLDSSINLAEIFPSTYHVHRKDRSRSGGGVLPACSQKISSIRRSELETDCEIMWCEIVISNPYSRIMVGVFYRPPSTDVSYLLELEKSLCLLEGSGNTLTTLLLGDFNLPNVVWSNPSCPVGSDTLSSTFCSISQDYFFPSNGLESYEGQQYFGFGVIYGS